MQVRLVSDDRVADLTVTVHDPTASVADLLDALAIGERTVTIDGRPAAPGDPLHRARLGDGSVISVGAWEVTDASLSLTVTTGFDVGRQVTVPIGRWVLGRADRRWRGRTPAPVIIDDPRLAIAHAGLEVHGPGTGRIRALGPAVVAPTHPTAPPPRAHARRSRRLVARIRTIRTDGPSRALPGWVPRSDADEQRSAPVPVGTGTRLLFGPVEVVFHLPESPGDVVPPAVGSATRPLHRRPRPPLPPDPTPVLLPTSPATPPLVTPVGALGVVASIAMGAVMVVLFHSWAYAAFALLGPVLVVANGLDGRRRRRHARRVGARKRQHDLAGLAAQLTEAAEVERRRRHDLHPGPVGLLGRCAGTAPTCWNRRASDGDAFAVRLGTGTGRWSPPIRGAAEVDDVAEVLAGFGHIADIAIGCRLDPAAPLAIVGPRPAALALARSMLVQATVDHGPVDLGVAVLTDRGRSPDWRWATWLPHTRCDDGEPLLADHPGATAVVAGRLLAPPSTTTPRRTVVVIDDPDGLAARRSGPRAVLRAAADIDRQLVPVVLVTDPLDVPAVCALVLTVDEDGRLRGPPWITAGAAELIGVGGPTADELARRLSRFDDPELDDAGRALPTEVGLVQLLATDPYDPGALAGAWVEAGDDPPPVATIGRAADGPLVVDLAVDGPHALVAGTTGSGKSELLRTLVASLALASSPAHLTFVLVDFKGGSAFDACARLPHTTGIVTDLDGHLAARALRCLEAELRHRERRLREVGASDLTAFRAAASDGDPLPRLVVVVDEFATLAAELPDFVDALVGIAQRGRSLGVHLVLATQRPAGAVSDHIRANTGLRIALRVHDVADSRDVIGTPGAAELPRQRPGRALARLGPGELVGFQAARVTGSTGSTGRVAVASQSFGTPASDARADPTSTGDVGGHPTVDLGHLVDAAVQAWAEVGGAPPRRPWPDPLPEVVEPDHLLLTAGAHASTTLVLGLADDPDRQRHIAFGWDLRTGPLLAVGLPGSGTTTLAARTVLGVAERWSADEFHVHIIDLGSGGLRPLSRLPHVGAVVAGDDLERQRRLLSEMVDDLAARRAAVDVDREDRPRRLLVVDGLTSLRAAWDDVEPTGTWNHLLELLAHGPTLGIAVMLTAAGIHGVPHQVLAACHQRLAFRLADRSDHAALGISPAAVPRLPAGRAISSDGEQLVQVTWPGADLGIVVDDLIAAADPAASPRLRRPPDPVAVLPDDLRCDAVPGPHVRLAADGKLALVIGLADEGLRPASLELASGGAALVVGPPRSGRTTALRALASAALGAAELEVVVVTTAPGEWSDHRGPVLHPDDPGLAALLPPLDRSGTPVLVLVDDADQIADDHPVLAPLVGRLSPTHHVVAAARADRLRGAYGHWLREVQASRTGLLLHPDLDLDGDLLGIRLPRRPALPLRAGRGWLTDRGPARLCQVMRSWPPEDR